MKKLSELMRQGAALRPQCFGVYSNGKESCAFMAAYEAWSGRLQIQLNDDLYRMCKACGVHPDNTYIRDAEGNQVALYIFVTHANDVLRWTREQTADWLEAAGY